jgi:hypothetical protein
VLTRNVKLQGDPTTEITKWGMHTMFFSPEEEGPSPGYISYVECFRCGQAFNLGRYPLHMHMMGNVAGSYIRGCAVHHTFNRAVTVHGVHYLEVTHNVAYDNMGHTFFMEDAVETMNDISYNLGLYTKASLSLLDTDTTPATFWITNPTNFVRHNAAAGSERYGFWYDLQKHPTGPSFNPNICPPGMPLGAFSNNTAHSNGRYGLRIFNFFDPRKDPCSWENSNYDDSPAEPAVFESLTSYKNIRSGVSALRIGQVKFEGFKLADNLRCGGEIVNYNGPREAAGFRDALIIAHSSLAPDPLPHELRDGRDPDVGHTVGLWSSGISFNLTYDGLTFVNFDRADVQAWSNCAHCNFPNTKFNGGKTTYVRNINYVNSNQLVHWSTPFKGVFLDEDGTGIGGVPGQYAVAASQTGFLDGLCAQSGAEWHTTDTFICPPEVKMARIGINGQKPSASFEFDPLHVRRITDRVPRCDDAGCSCGTRNWTLTNCTYSDVGSVDYKNKLWKDPSDGWAFPLPVNQSYSLDMDGDADWTELVLALSYLNPGDWIMIELGFLSVPHHFGIKLNDVRIADPSNTTFPVPTDPMGSAYVNNDDGSLTILLTGDGNPYPAMTDTIKLLTFQCEEIDGKETCPTPPPPPEVEPEDFIRRWSNASIWRELGHDDIPAFPNAKDAVVTIPAAWNVLLDMEYVQLQHLEVYGRLLFDDSMKSTTLRVQTLQIWDGEVLAGNATHPFSGKLNIEFWAYPWEPVLELGNEVNAGTNVLLVLGRLELYGLPRTTKWTRLSATAAKGSPWLETVDDVASNDDWVAGDEIVLSSTSHDPFDAERATIAAVFGSSGSTILLQAPLQYTHFGAPSDESFSNGKRLDVRGEVGVVSSNIRISSGAWAVENFGFGCQVLVASYEGWTGSAVLDNVHIDKCGQRDSTRYALNFNNPSATNASSVTNTAITESSTSALHVLGATDMQIVNNIIYDSYGGSVEIVHSSNIHLEVTPFFLHTRESLHHLFFCVQQRSLCSNDTEQPPPSHPMVYRTTLPS